MDTASALELTTFGALMRFAIRLERSAASFYQSAEAVDDGALPACSSLRQEHERRAVLLERVRREKLNEIMLEPVSGLEGQDYVLSTELPAGARGPQILEVAVGLEKCAQRFYEDSARIGKMFSREVTRVLEKLGRENVGYVALLMLAPTAP